LFFKEVGFGITNLNFFQNWVAAYTNWGDTLPLLLIYTDTNIHVLENELHFQASPSPLQCCSLSFLFSFVPYKLITLAGNNFEYKSPNCKCFYVKNQEKMTPIPCRHLNFIPDRASSGQGCLRLNVKNDRSYVLAAVY